MLEKMLSFLSEYLDLYGDDIFIDSDRLERIKSELNLPMKPAGEELKPSSAIQPAKISSVKRPDSPLWKFRDEIKDCLNCPLGYSRTKFVFGDGNPNADIMFVGEAPGADQHPS